MGAAFAFERVCYLMYTSHILYTALTNPNIFGHLTYWSLCLQSVYFTIDKASPNAATPILVLHGTAVIGAFAVMLGYSTMAVGGVYRFGFLVSGGGSGVVLGVTDASPDAAEDDRSLSTVWGLSTYLYQDVYAQMQ